MLILKKCIPEGRFGGYTAKYPGNLTDVLVDLSRNPKSELSATSADTCRQQARKVQQWHAHPSCMTCFTAASVRARKQTAAG